ncbi:MAG: SWIM zinc finger family protein, partial [Bacteroidota bacterium]
MEFNYKYKGSSKVNNTAGSTGISFAPDTFREPTFFKGLLNKKIPFREAISALHHIVVSDFRYQPKDRTAYLEWLKTQEDIWMAEIMANHQEVKAQLDAKRFELNQLNNEANKIMKPYYDAQRRYFKHLYVRDKAAWMVLDPVISVHPDSLFFECFSKDESSYGKLSCNYNVFKKVNEFECGTTNIDYSYPLYNEFQKIRTYKETDFEIDPSGFEVQTGEYDAFKEVKIDLPDSWVRGFLQVSSAMTMKAYQFDIDPVDMRNILFFLSRNKEKHGPRSIRWILEPGKPVSISVDPWNEKMICGKSIYKGSTSAEVRMWGRRRLKLLERMLPVSRKIKVTLLGTGMPSFFEADLVDMTFTLGLSGWTNNDWSRSSNFDLMIPRYNTDGNIQQKVFLELKKVWFISAEDMANRLGLTTTVVESVMTNFIQEGKVIYDLKDKVYRLRELTKDPLPMDKLRYRNEREQLA